MADDYQYPVFFECENLPDKYKEKIQTYFRVRRKSGGGDCGPVNYETDRVYSVYFKHHKDQQAVLKKPEHVVKLADGQVVFTVRASLEPPASDTETTASDKGSTATVKALLNPASTPPSSGENYELQPDIFLFRYLVDCPEVWEEIKEELACVSCAAQLDCDQGKVLVWTLAQPGAVDCVRNWKADVDKVFDNYVCYYDVEPDKVEALRWSCLSPKSTCEARVYSRFGMVAVVGKRSRVDATLADLENKSSIRERKAKVFQPRTSKLGLLWKKIVHTLRRDIPEVKVTEGKAGQIKVEGTTEEIDKAGDLVASMEKLVMERKVSGVSPHLLTFLRKAFEDPALLGEFLGVDGEVKIEFRGTELYFFTLSADKLDETEERFREEFTEASFDIPDSVVPCELLEKLDGEKNKEQLDAQVLFGSDNKLCLVGHTKDVEVLSEVVRQFVLEQSSTVNEVLYSEPAPEGVLLEPNVDSSRVRYFRRSLQSDEPFSADVSSPSLSEPNRTVASYSLAGGLKVLVCHGDITKQEADALVNAANEELVHCGGVAAALSRAGGPDVQRESEDLVKCLGRIPTGDVVVTTGGHLKCKRLLHAVGPIGGASGGTERVLLEKAVHTALNLSELMEFQSITIPCISSGSFDVPIHVCSQAIVTSVRQFGSQGGRSLQEITLIDNRVEVVRVLHEACESLLQGAPISPPADIGFRMVSAPDEALGPGDSVHVEIVQGTIETQQVDAVVSPMVGHEPLSTRVGNTLFQMVGPALTAAFRKKAQEEMFAGDTVLVEGLSGLKSNAVFFINLAPCDYDQEGTAVQALRMGINQILTSCDTEGFRSVAFPVLGAGIALQFPDILVAKVLLEEIHSFEQERAASTPFIVRIVIHPSDKPAFEVFKLVQKEFQLEETKRKVQQLYPASGTKRIVLLGKTGSGKSNLANTIFGEELFTTNHTPNSGTRQCQAETKSVNGRSITLIDTPGFFDVERSEEDMKPEIVRCITECAPGPHAFLIVLKVEKFTEQEQAVITKICQYFSEDALKYAVIVFTHGDQLPKGVKIEEFVRQSRDLSELVRKCGGRCHVIDNKYWKNKVQGNYRSNQFQVGELLSTIDQMVMENNGDFYKNKMFQEVEKEIQREEENIRKCEADMPEDKIREEAKARVSKRFLIQLAGTATGALIGAFFGLAGMVGIVITVLQNVKTLMNVVKKMPLVAAAAGGVEAAGVTAAGVVVGVGAVGLATAGAAIGGSIGREAAEGAQSPREAMDLAAKAVMDKGKSTLKM